MTVTRERHTPRIARPRLTLLVPVGVSAIVATGCIVYDPKLVEGGMDAGPPTEDVGQFDAGPVTSRQPPARPTDPDDGVDMGEVSFGLRMVSLDQGDGWREIGYDLDNRTTIAPTYDTECIPPGTPRPPGDGADGIDNVFGASLYPLVELTVPGLEMTAREAQESGYGLPVIRITGWNGTPNDSRIRTVITTSVFTTSAVGAGPDMPPIVEIVGPRDIRIGGAPAPPRNKPKPAFDDLGDDIPF